VSIIAASLVIQHEGVPFLKGLFGADSWTLKIIPFLDSHLVLVIALGISEWFIRKHLWRWRWQLAELDFSGEWEGVSYYEKMRIGDNTKDLPPPARHRVRIKQDCICFKIIPSPAPGGRGYWESKATSLISADHLVYAYEVHYGGREGFPDVAFGYEDMHVVKRDKKQRPCVLNGTFNQCAIGKEPIYSGSAIFRRVGTAHRAKNQRKSVGKGS
jgi:hypothetical protein